MLTATAFPGASISGAERLTRAGRLFVTVMLIVIFEGAIRKWLSSATTLPLVLSRDILALYAIYYAFSRGHFHRHKGMSLALLAWSCCVVMWGMLQLILGESNPKVFVIGLRFWLLYIWFACAVTASMTEYDFRVATKVVLWTLLLMGPLVAVQHLSPPGAFINTEVDSEGGDVFEVAAGVVRTTGTFSFTVGYTTFVALCAPLVLLMLESRKRTKGQRLFALAVLGAFVAGSIVSGSRSTVLFSGGMLALYLIGSVFLAPGRRKGIALLAIVFIVLVLGLFLYIFQGAVEATQSRFQAASQAEDFVGRIATIFIGEPAVYQRFVWTGAGVGLGSNLANYVQSGDTSFFALAETETGRTLLEGGLLGYAFAALKALIAIVAIAKSSLQAMRTRTMFPVLVWITISFAMFSWSYVGQLSINALFGVLFALGLLTFKFHNFRVFG